MEVVTNYSKANKGRRQLPGAISTTILSEFNFSSCQTHGSGVKENIISYFQDAKHSTNKQNRTKQQQKIMLSPSYQKNWACLLFKIQHCLQILSFVSSLFNTAAFVNNAMKKSIQVNTWAIKQKPKVVVYTIQKLSFQERVLLDSLGNGIIKQKQEPSHLLSLS